jgi:hypothetical protein
LEALRVDAAFAPHSVKDADMAAACLAGLWLLLNYLDQSHNLSQNIATPTGSYWHGLMHRREPDYANAAYWFRRVGRHPIFPAVKEGAGNLFTQDPQPVARALVDAREWDPFAFLDLCQSALGTGSSVEKLCREIQQREWEILFDYCYRAAIGENS